MKILFLSMMVLWFYLGCREAYLIFKNSEEITVADLFWIFFVVCFGAGVHIENFMNFCLFSRTEGFLSKICDKVIWRKK